MRIRDREAAGRLLAHAVGRHDLDDPVVIGLGCGGVAVGAEVARALNCPLDVIDVQELGSGDPLHPNRAFGAVSGRGHLLIRTDNFEHTPAGRRAARNAIAWAQGLIRRDGGRPPGRGGSVPISWRTVVLVDDGTSSGDVMAAALDLVRAGRPGRVMLAVPTASQETIDGLEHLAGEVIVGQVVPWTEWFRWHGRPYEENILPTEEQVGQLLHG